MDWIRVTPADLQFTATHYFGNGLCSGQMVVHEQGKAGSLKELLAMKRGIGMLDRPITRPVDE